MSVLALGEILLCTTPNKEGGSHTVTSKEGGAEARGFPRRLLLCTMGASVSCPLAYEWKLCVCVCVCEYVPFQDDQRFSPEGHF